MSTKEIRLAEETAEMLVMYAYEEGEGERDSFGDDYILDNLLRMHEVLHKGGTDEGRFLEHYSLIVDHSVKLFETIEVERMLSGTRDKLKVMAIFSVRPFNDGKAAVSFLGAKVRD